VEALKHSFPHNDFAILALVLALPAIGAFVNGVFGKRIGKEGVRLMALAAIGGAFLFSLVTFLSLPHGAEGHAGRLTWSAYHWFSVTGQVGRTVPVDVAFGVDAMSATMMLVITGVGFLIHLYSTEYMAHDESFHRFFAYLNLFCFSMLVLVMADNLVVLFVGWEGVGMCSYLLIGFWFGESKNASAGRKAFIVNRIGDFGLIVAISLIIYFCGSVQWSGIDHAAGGLLQTVKVWPLGNLPTGAEWDATHRGASGILAAFVHVVLPNKPVLVYASTLVGLALFLGCAGKSAQLPLYVWLPDAMAGPTPVSALIHAATMVTAGVYLVARTSSVFLLAPAAMAVVATVGALTAVFAASMGLFQRDLKKVLAYSTVSQLGFMFIGVGVGAFAAGFFHVLTHAFFKACLFLGAGSVIFQMHKRIHDTDASQDMNNMGGLRKYMPITHATFLASCLAIAGCPPFSGFWSKDEILWQAFSIQHTSPEVAGLPIFEWPAWLGPTIFWLGIAAATMTSFYMFRAYFMTFHGTFKGWTIVKGWKEPAHHGHDDHGHGDHGHGPLEGGEPTESPMPIVLPLVVLGTLAVFAGFLNAEPIHVAPLGHMLEPIFEHSKKFIGVREAAKGMMWTMMAPGFGAFVVGAGAAFWAYQSNGGEPERAFAKSSPRFYQLLVDKWRVDEFYDATVIGMVDALADIFVTADRWIIDGILARLSAALVGFFGTVLRAFQTGRVQVYSAAMVIGLASIGWFFARSHADLVVDDAELRKTGDVVITAPAGLGYSYRWEVPGEQSPPDFGTRAERKISLKEGETKDVLVSVKNAFGHVETKAVPLSRPSALKLPQMDPGAMRLPTPPSGGTVPAQKIPDMLRGKGH
jgi:NADH-quinone oxidoreductase subunit L